MPNPGEVDVQTLPDGTVITTTWSTVVDGGGQPIGNTVQVTPPPNSPAANLQTLQAQGLQAIQNNIAYLAILTPTPGQVSAQVTALTRQNDGIIRLLLNALDSTAGT